MYADRSAPASRCIRTSPQHGSRSAQLSPAPVRLSRRVAPVYRNSHPFRGERRKRILEILNQVGLDEEHLSRFPHEFSGGQRQRIGIARALICRPNLIIADEPVSALDVSIQAQIINLMRDLKAEFNLTYLFVAHDLSVIRHISDRVVVMYLGKIVETGPRDRIFDQTLHPYTQALLAAVPEPDPEIRSAVLILTGDIPSPVHPPSGCRFRTRCTYAKAICSGKEPPLTQHRPGQFAACWFVDEIQSRKTD